MAHVSRVLDAWPWTDQVCVLLRVIVNEPRSRQWDRFDYNHRVLVWCCDFSKTSRSVGGLFVVWLMIPMKWVDWLHRRDCPNIRTLFHADVWYSPWFTLFSADIVPCNIWPSTNQVSRKSLYTKLIQSCRDVSKLFPSPPEASCYRKNAPNISGPCQLYDVETFSTGPRRTSHRRMRCRPTSSPSSDMSTFHLKAPTFFTGSVLFILKKKEEKHEIGSTSWWS